MCRQCLICTLVMIAVLALAGCGGGGFAQSGTCGREAPVQSVSGLARRILKPNHVRPEPCLMPLSNLRDVPGVERGLITSAYRIKSGLVSGGRTMEV